MKIKFEKDLYIIGEIGVNHGLIKISKKIDKVLNNAVKFQITAEYLVEKLLPRC